MKKALLLFGLSFSALLGDDGCCPPPPRPKVENCRSFNSVSFVEYLYWKYTTPALVFGRDGIGLTNGVLSEVNVAGTGRSFSPKFKYDSGYRLGFAFSFGEQKAFDIVARYTWFYTNPHRTVTQFSTSFLPLNWLDAFSLSTPTYSLAKLSMHLHYHFPEMQFGYTFKVNRYLALRPYIALSSIMIDGDLRTKYELTTTGGVFEISNMHGESFSWSIGPKLGLDFTARPWDSFAVYCGFNITQQASQISMKANQTLSRPALGDVIHIQKGELSQVRSVGLFGLEIGPVWDEWFADNQYHLQLRAVWQLSTLGGGNLSFLNNNNVDVPVGAELRGFNVRALFEF